MNILPDTPSVILSSAEPLHSKGSDSRFPFATAFAALIVVQLGLVAVSVILFALLHFDVPDIDWPIKLAEAILGGVVTYFIFRWAINKHIIGNVAPATGAMVEYGRRLSFKNPFLAGLVAYLAINMLISSVVDPIPESIKQNSWEAYFILGLLLNVVTGYFAFTLAVKRVVLRPYSAKRLWPMLGLIFVLSISVTFAIEIAKARQEWAFRNHIYCEVLQPGMTQTEVTTALSEYEMLGQVSTSYGFDMPGTGKIESFTIPYFKDSELRYRLNLVLGYDSNNTLVAVGREDMNPANYALTVSAIECPLPFR